MIMQALALQISSGTVKRQVQVWGQLKGGSDTDGINLGQGRN